MWSWVAPPSWMMCLQFKTATSLSSNTMGLCILLVASLILINITSPRGYTGETEAYIINHYTWYKQKYWTLFITSNDTTVMEALEWNDVTHSYPTNDWYHNPVSQIRFTVRNYNSIQFNSIYYISKNKYNRKVFCSSLCSQN